MEDKPFSFVESHGRRKKMICYGLFAETQFSSDLDCELPRDLSGPSGGL